MSGAGLHWGNKKKPNVFVSFGQCHLATVKVLATFARLQLSIFDHKRVKLSSGY